MYLIYPKLHGGNLDEIAMSLKQEIVSDLTDTLAKIKKRNSKTDSSIYKENTRSSKSRNSDSEAENTCLAPT